MRGSRRPTSAIEAGLRVSGRGVAAGTDLRGGYVRLARLDGADLSDANLEGIEGLMQAQMDRAHSNSGTTLPGKMTGVEDGKR